MFERARRRLAIRYVAILMVVIGAFSAVFFGVLVVVLQPDFDATQDLSPRAVEERAYRRAIERIALAIALADGAVLTVVGLAAYYVAGRTLGPIREAHDRQRRFVADASHEMRTPITAIRSTAESALAEGDPSPPERTALETIVASTDRLTSVTGDLLLLARSERGVLAERHADLDLSVVVAEAVAAARRGDRSGARIELTLEPDLVVSADEQEIGRIVTNLVDNALQHATGPTAIRVRTCTLDGLATVEVADDGPGIPDEDVEHVFEPFYRVRSATGPGDGTGLGLAIAADCARRNQGRLTLVPTGGRGATFRLQLPRARSA